MAEWTRETPLRSPEYAALVDEFRAADDRHERYLLASLVRWHVPVPWSSWPSFVVNYKSSERVCPHHESFGSCPVFGCPHHQPSEGES